jgi:hypothetical protein
MSPSHDIPLLALTRNELIIMQPSVLMKNEDYSIKPFSDDHLASRSRQGALLAEKFVEVIVKTYDPISTDASRLLEAKDVTQVLTGSEGYAEVVCRQRRMSEFPV